MDQNMPEDFHIQDAVAFQWDEWGSRWMREPPRERIEALRSYLYPLLERESEPAEDHRCPICGGELMISFEYYIEIPKELDISTDCSQCKVNVYFKSDRIPSWARAVSIRDLPGFFD